MWCSCDAPSTLAALQKMGLQDDPQVRSAVESLAALGRENGWPCKADSRLGKFKGPGKRSDPCPYANLIMLKMLAARPDLHDTPNVRSGLETALFLWESSRSQKPYLFKMGTDFRKLKVPFIWYDLLHLAETLSQFPQVYEDNRFIEILSVLESKQGRVRQVHQRVYLDQVVRMGILPETRTFALGHALRPANIKAGRPLA